MVQIRLIEHPDPSLDALLQRVYERADSLGVSREDALREGLNLWLRSVGSGAEYEAIHVSPAERRVLVAVLDCLRSHPGAPGDTNRTPG